MSTDEDRNPAWGWYAAWAVVGGGIALSILGAMTIGVLLAPVFVLAGALLGSRPNGRGAVTGAIAGPALPLLWVAWLNRDGPGNVCTTTPTSQSCMEEWSPWPWLLAAIGFVALGIAVTLLVRRSAARARARNEAASAYQFGTEMPPRR